MSDKAIRSKYMNEMNTKKMYLVKLADFLVSNSMTMSGQELAEHLNRNSFLTSYGTEYQGGRGIYKLISQTYYWLEELGLSEETKNFPRAFVQGNGDYPWDK